MKRRLLFILFFFSLNFCMQPEDTKQEKENSSELSDPSHSSEGESTSSVLLQDRLAYFERKLENFTKLIGEKLELEGSPLTFSSAIMNLYKSVGPGLKADDESLAYSDALLLLFKNIQILDSQNVALVDTIEQMLTKHDEDALKFITIFNCLYQRIKSLESQNAEQYNTIKTLQAGNQALKNASSKIVSALILLKKEVDQVKQQRIQIEVSNITNTSRLTTVPLDQSEDATPVAYPPSSAEPLEMVEPENPGVKKSSKFYTSHTNLGGIIADLGQSAEHRLARDKIKREKKKNKKKPKKQRKKIRKATPRDLTQGTV